MSSLGIHKVSNEEKAELAKFIEAHPRLSSEMPATLPCGFKIEVFNPVCSKCRNDIPMAWSWLNRVCHEFGQNKVEIWDVLGLCKECRTVTPCYLRFRSDGTYDTLIGDRWRHGRLNGHDKRTRTLGKMIVRRVLRWLLGGR